MFISDDGFLLQKKVHKSTIKRVIDWKSLGINKEYIKEQCNLKYGPLDEKFNFKDSRVFPETQDEIDKFYVVELCMPYNPPPDDKDIFVYYDDMKGKILSGGTTGYIRIRDGYVYGMARYSIS